VLRRILRRAVRHAYLLGSETLVLPELVATAVDVMGDAFPDVRRNASFITDVIAREEERFRHTLRTGVAILEDELAAGGTTLPGSAAFKLHDTYGFPLELTQEIADERGVTVDVAGFNVEMTEQRRRAKEARKAEGVDEDRVDAYRELVEQFGTTEFTGYASSRTEGARVLAVLETPGGVEIFLDRTPFYAESGGQVGDTGDIATDTGRAEVLDTTFALPGLRRHTARIVDGQVTAGQEAIAAIDAGRRDAIRRNHTGTHVLHWALREVLGDHVKQAGSLVAPDRLRFDFSHYAPVTPDEIERIEDLANGEVLSNDPVRAYETTKSEAEAMGAIAFFGDKYGEVVRVLEAGRHSLELCGGTHVRATGDIGTIKIVSEGSIGSNLRRIEAVTGTNSVALLQRDERELARAALLLGTSSDTVVDAINKRLEEIKALREELRAARAKSVSGRAVEIGATATDGVVISRADGMTTNDLRDLALAVRQQPGVNAVVLVGATDTGGAALVAAVTAASGLVAGELIREAARAVKGGGGGGKGDVAVAGGKDPSGVDEALALARKAAGV
jgi:alanyl-tRNA synthetase